MSWSKPDLKTPEGARYYYRRNMLRFFNTHLKIIDREAAGNKRLVPFKLNRAQRSLHELIEELAAFNLQRTADMRLIDRKTVVTQWPIKVRILKARKVGVSTYLQARAFHKCEFHAHTNALIMAHEQKSSQNIAMISKRFHQYWLPKIDFRRPIDRSADQMLAWDPEWDSRLIVATAGSGSGVARSFTYQFIHISEEAHFPKKSDEVAVADTAAATFVESYSESTANGVTGTFADGWRNAMWLKDLQRLYTEKKPFPEWWNGEIRYFWAWHDDPDYALALPPQERERFLDNLSPAENLLLKDFRLTFEQLQWRRRKIRGECSKQNKVPDPELYFDQEYPKDPDTAFISKGLTVFPQATIRKLQEAAPEPERYFVVTRVAGDEKTPGFTSEWVLSPAPNKYAANFVIWEDPEPGTAYVMGGDAAEGREQGDYSVLSFWNRNDGRKMHEAARFRAKTPAAELGEIANFLGRLYNDAYFVMEGNAPGNATCLVMIQLQYLHLYHRENPEIITDHQHDESFTAGFKTMKNTKRMIVELGQHALRDGLIEIRDKDALLEWLHYQNIDGKLQAPTGENDDCVITDLLALYGHQQAAPPVTHWKKKSAESTLSAEEAQHEDIWRKIRAMKEKATKKHDKIMRMKARAGINISSGSR